MITSRSVNAVLVFILASVSQLLGTIFFGTKVAFGTINGLFNLSVIDSTQKLSIIVCAAMLGAVSWNIITWLFAIPSSSSHALIGGLIGPIVIQYGFGAVNRFGLLFSVLIPLFLSPIIGYIVGTFLFKVSRTLLGNRGRGANTLVKWVQVVSSVLINAFQGSNDAQKGIGVLALLVLSTGTGRLEISQKMIWYSALAISAGLVLGGLKMIRSVGTRIYNVRPLHSMSAQISAASVIVFASLLGFPISGTQVVNSAVMGTGAADRPNAVGWAYAKSMLTAWVVTIPASFALSSLFYFILNYFLGV